MDSVAFEPSVARRLRRWEGLPYWLILPTVAYLGFFFAWPMLKAFELSVRVGGVWTTEPYRAMVHDPAFGTAVRVTVLFIAFIVPAQFALALTMALIANSKIKGRGIFLFLVILPLGASDLAAGIAWYAIFTQHGYLNTVLQDLGLRHIPYIWINPTQHPTHVVLEIVAAEIWRSTALITVILMAGLQSIPKEYSEAAEVFGAGFFARLRTVILPMIKPAIKVALVFRVVSAFELFALVQVFTGGSFAGNTGSSGASITTLALETYNQQNNLLNTHVAAAYAAFILVLSLMSVAILMRIFRTPRAQLMR